MHLYRLAIKEECKVAMLLCMYLHHWLRLTSVSLVLVLCRSMQARSCYITAPVLQGS